MIRVDIHTGSGIITLDDEIENLAWSVKNPEGLPFQVSLPVVSANIVLHTISADLSNIKRGDKAHVVNPEGEVKLVLNVVLVTILKDKGITEIAFEGLPVDGNKLGNGVFNTAQNYLNDSVYSGSVRLGPTSQLARGNALISKRQDYLLAHLWGGSKLLNIAPTEYTGADKDFKLVEFDNAEGYVPDYEVTPDNLISFEISPAQPPVTGLRIAQRVENKPTSIISVPDGVDLAKGFFIEGDVKAQAVYTLREKKSGEGPRVIASQQLSWADGHVLELGTTQLFIAGIFTDSYVQVERLSSESPHALLKRKDKYTKEDIGEPVLLNNVDYYFEEPTSYSKMLVEPTITTVVEGREVMWFNNVRNERIGYLRVGLTKDMVILDAEIGDWNGVVPSHVWYDFVSAYCGNDFASIILVQPFDLYGGGVRYVRVRQTGDASVVIDFAGYSTAIGFSDDYALAEAIDAFDNHMRGSEDSICILFETFRYGGPDVYETVVMNVTKTGVNHLQVLEGTFQFLDSGDKEVSNYAQAPIIQLLPEKYNEPLTSNPLLLWNNLFEKKVINMISAIDFLVWFNFGSRYTRYRSNCINVFYVNDLALEGEEIYRLVMFDEPVPWAQRKVGELSKVHELSKGVENIIDLPFIVRDLAELRIPVKESGRIVLDLASFDYTIAGVTETAVVQNLELPALMSFVKVRTSFESNLRIMQVTGADIEYRGAMRLRLQGIIRYEIVPQALTELSEVLVGVEYWFRQPLDYVDNSIARFETPGNYILFRRRRRENYAVLEETLIGRITLIRVTKSMAVYLNTGGQTHAVYKNITFADYNAGDEIWTFQVVKEVSLSPSSAGLDEFVTTIGGHID